jgi:nitrate reductase NapE component
VNGPRFLVVAIVSVAIVGTLAFVVLLQTVLSF